MAESYVQVTEGDSGKKLHTFTRTVGGNEVHDEVVVRGMPYLPSYVVSQDGLDGSGTLPTQLVLMSGSSKRIYVRAIEIMVRSATAAGFMQVQIQRVVSAPSGGSARTPAPMDPSDPAAASTATVAPTGGAAASATIKTVSLPTAASAPQPAVVYRWEPLHTKPLIVPSGTSNGIAIVVSAGVAGGLFTGHIEYDEETG